MNPQMKDLFDALQDAVVIVDREGVVRHANQTALALFQPEAGKPFPDPLIVRRVADLVAGIARSPLNVVVKRDKVPQAARILPLPLPGLYAIVARDAGAKTFYETTLKNFHEYLRADLAEPMQRFARRLDLLDERPDAAEVAKLAADGRLLAERLQRIERLAELFGGSPLVDQERLQFREMIEQALNDAAPTLAARGIEVFLDGLDAELPPVYGSRAWLARALRELLDNVGRHATPKSNLEIALRCTGTHVIVSLRNHGQFAGAHLRTKTHFVPFGEAAEYLDARKKPGAPATAKGPGLGLAIVEQIMQLHGGHLNVVEGSNDGVVEFNLELATGAPARDTQALGIEQAKRYAHDLATLVGRMRPAQTPATAKSA